MKNRIPQTPKLLKAKTVERDRQLEAGMLVACECQDPAELVRRGHKISPGFMIAQKKKNRLIMDKRKVNSECHRRSVKYDMLNSLSTLAGKGWYFQSRDILDGYGNFGVWKGDWKLQTIDLGYIPGDPGPRFVMATTLTFGYVNSPFLFCSWIRAGPIRELRSMGVRVMCYVDDFLIASRSYEESVRHGKLFDSVMAKYGLAVHPVKGERSPVQVIDHLGLRCDSVRNLFLVPPDRLTEIRKMARQVLGAASSNKRRVNARFLAQFAGTCISLLLAVPMGRYHTRAFFDALVKAGVYGMSTAELRACSAWDRVCVLNKQCFRELMWWRHLGEGTGVGRAIWRPPVNETMATDASKWKWGGVLNAARLRPHQFSNMKYWDGVEQIVPAWGVWDEWEREQHITFLELRAFRYSLEALGSKGLGGGTLRGKVLLLWEDNAAVVSILTNYTSRSPQMMGELRLVVLLLQSLDLELRVRWVESASNPSDFWTRFSDKAEWQLLPSLAHSVMHTWGVCTVDRFAMASNALLPRFNAPIPTLGAESVDAFATSWEGERSWVNAPWNKLSQVLHKLEVEKGAAAVVLAPVWPTAMWWPVLQSLQTGSVGVHLDTSTVLRGEHCPDVAEPLRNPWWRVRAWHIPARA